MMSNVPVGRHNALILLLKVRKEIFKPMVRTTSERLHWIHSFSLKALEIFSSGSPLKVPGNKSCSPTAIHELFALLVSWTCPVTIFAYETGGTATLGGTETPSGNSGGEESIIMDVSPNRRLGDTASVPSPSSRLVCCTSGGLPKGLGSATGKTGCESIFRAIDYMID
ncbi:unnamed protein product [Linum trigynum]|uniref:Uncharacterized protein n=1 Tax=Linum trigynum TaxID=586398 RepID=A0AAV2EAQ4_9ROSI